MYWRRPGNGDGAGKCFCLTWLETLNRIKYGSSGKRVPEAAVSGPTGRILHGVPSGLESSGSHHRWLKPPALILFPFGEPGTPQGLCRKAGDFSHRKRIPTVPVVLKGRCQVRVCRMNLKYSPSCVFQKKTQEKTRGSHEQQTPEH